MEMVKIPKAEYEKLKIQVKKLEKLEKIIDLDLIKQFNNSLKDLKEGKIRKVA